MKTNVTQHKCHEVFADRMKERRWEEDYRGIQGYRWDRIWVPICADGEQVSLLSASSNMLCINLQFITSWGKTH
jgi:hypothetical protein